MRIAHSLSVLAFTLLTTGCASIMHGTKQDIGISSSPTNARVIVDNQPLGATPMVAKLARGDNHIVRIEMDGYAPFEATLTKKVSGWVWGNIVFGGFIGLAVDAISGGLYNLTPEQVAAQLSQHGASAPLTEDGLYVLLVPRVDPEWVRIGMLAR
jgi:uncharacterized protein YceK